MGNERSRALTYEEHIGAVNERSRAWDAVRSAAQVIATKSEYIRDARSCSEGFDGKAMHEEFALILTALDRALASAIDASNKAGG